MKGDVDIQSTEINIDRDSCLSVKEKNHKSKSPVDEYWW